MLASAKRYFNTRDSNLQLEIGHGRILKSNLSWTWKRFRPNLDSNSSLLL